MTVQAEPGWGQRYVDQSVLSTDTSPAAMMDRLLIQEAISRFGWGFDNRDEPALRGLFTADAEWFATVADSDEIGPFVGVDAVLTFMQAAWAAQTDQRRHNLVNPVLRVLDSDDAVADTYLMLTTNAGGAAAVIGTGFYRFTLRRVDSSWRVAKMFLCLDSGE